MKYLLPFLLVSSSAFAQSGKVPITLDCQTHGFDLVGSQVCAALQDIVGSNPRYQPSKTNPNAYELRVMSIDDGHGSAISTVLLLHHTLISQSVSTCEAPGARSCAENMMSGFDEDVAKMQKMTADLQPQP
jgi:hypothetical protein